MNRVPRVLILVAACLLTLMLSRTASAGAFVVRFQDQLGFFVVDEANGLMSFHGTDQTFAQICAGGGLTFENLDIQLVGAPTGVLHALFTSADQPVVIYPIASLPDPHHVGPGDCPILANLQPVAWGRARLVRTDNDLLGTGSANAFGWTCNGVLTDATGASRVYGETVRAVTTPGELEPREVQTSIRLGR
jgi:hypothetical protein